MATQQIARWRRLVRWARWREDLQGWMFASPFVVGFLVWYAFPFLYSIWLVFHSWDLITPAKLVGLKNFRLLLGDPNVATALWNTAYYTFAGVPIHLALALLLALALNVKIRGVSIYRTLFYLPSITPAVASAVIWLQILHPEFGILNSVLRIFGIPPVNWLYDPSVAKPAFILMTCWTVGPQMVIFLAGLYGIPSTLYEAAEVDGAGLWHRFVNITLPMLSPVIFFNLIMGVIGSFQVFTAAYIMTAGGPQDATLFFVLYVFRNGFSYFKMGYASLLAWVLFWIIAFFTFIQFRLGSRWVYYEA
jgi:multiple sugar transport system permease protein